MVAGEEKKEGVTYRMGNNAATNMLLWAAFFDVLSFIPIVNDVVVGPAMFFFFICFNFLYRVPTFGKRTWLWSLIAFLVELIPFFSIFPTYMLMVFRLTAISRIEDRLKAAGLNVEGAKTKAMARLALKNKNVQLQLKKMERGAARSAARNKDGTLDKQKYGDKRARIADRRADLDRSLSGNTGGAKNSGDANSGVKAGKEPYQDYLTGGDYDPKRYGPLARFAKPATYDNPPTSLQKPPANDNPESQSEDA